MKIPTDECEIPQWLEVCRNALSGVENHLVKRLVLMAKAFKPWGSGDFSCAEYCEENAAPLFEAAAAGDADASGALCMIASRLLARRESLPPRLAVYASGVLGEKGFSKPSRRRGRFDPHDHAVRNIIAIRLIETICAERGLFATRNDAEKETETAVPSERVSACSFVAPLVGMTERGVEEVWRNRKQFGTD